jgi:hypothetical protein
MGNADDAPIQVLLRGPDITKLFEVGDSVMKVIKQIPGTNDVVSTQIVGQNLKNKLGLILFRLQDKLPI